MSDEEPEPGPFDGWHVERYMSSDKPDAKQIGWMVCLGPLTKFPLPELTFDMDEDPDGNISRLIAAAPDLLRRALGFLLTGGPNVGSFHDQLVSDLRAALGEQGGG